MIKKWIKAGALSLAFMAINPNNYDGKTEIELLVPEKTMKRIENGLASRQEVSNARAELIRQIDAQLGITASTPEPIKPDEYLPRR